MYLLTKIFLNGDSEGARWLTSAHANCRVAHERTNIYYQFRFVLHHLCVCAYTHVHICIYVCIDVYMYIHADYRVQGGEDSKDALSCRSIFAKEPLIIGLFCGK